jgi:predicted dithiol-disulfide oxidoreductase (DUF899 family)
VPSNYLLIHGKIIHGKICEGEKMVHETINGTYRQTNLANESAEYLAKREELRLAEVDLMKSVERIAALRRELPQGAPIEDYLFQEGPANLDAGDDPVHPIHLSELFTAPGRPLVVYHFMYGKAQKNPCPMCTMGIDGYNGVAHHITQHVDFVVAAAADPKDLRAHARKRAWTNLRLLSCGENTFKYDLGSEDRDGQQDSAMSVFTKDEKGVIRHFYTSHPRMAEDIKERGLDLLCPVYNFFDLTPQGRPNWYASLNYAPKVRAANP